MPTSHDNTKPAPESIEDKADEEIGGDADGGAKPEGSSEISIRLQLLGKLIIPPTSP